MPAWPNDTRLDLDNFYSKHRLGADGRPTPSWQSNNLTRITLPYPMTLAWDLSVQVKKVLCHKLVAQSLQQVLAAILAHYGSVNEVKTARMHLFGGCYNYRPIAGSARLSTHSWGAGIDLDPDRNPLGKAYDADEGMMPLAAVNLFEAEGWKWGGRFVTRPDCMHFQATK